MKILFIHNNYLDSESANVLQVLYMCDAFARLGNEVVLAVPFPRNNQKSQRIMIKEKLGKDPEFRFINYKWYNIFERFKFVAGYFGIKNILETSQYDIVYTRNIIPLGLALKMRKKVLYESHTFKMHHNLLLSNYFKNQLIHFANYRNLLKIVAISKGLQKAWIEAGIPQKKLLVLHDAICTDGFIQKRDTIIERKKLNLPLDRKLVIYVGSLASHHGIEDIIKLAAINKDLYFVIVGGPESQKTKYEKLARKNGIRNVLFTGYKPHSMIYSYLFSADVLLLVRTEKDTNINYCSPLKIFEYMASGKVIVGYNFPTIREILTNGENAFLVSPRSINELDIALKKALSLEYPNTISEKARTEVLEYYTWRKRAKKIAEEINKSEKEVFYKKYK